MMNVFTLQQMKSVGVPHWLFLPMAFHPRAHLPRTLERGRPGLLLGVRSQAVGWGKHIRKRSRGRQGAANLIQSLTSNFPDVSEKEAGTGSSKSSRFSAPHSYQTCGCIPGPALD